MKIKEIYWCSQDEMRESIDLEINGTRKFSVLADRECPEDNYFSRNLSDIKTIPDLMKLAYEAGVNGEEFVVTREIEQP